MQACVSVTGDGVPITMGLTVYMPLNPKAFVVRAIQQSDKGCRVQLGIRGMSMWSPPNLLYSRIDAAVATVQTTR